MKFKDTIGIFENAFTEAECKAIMYKLEEGIQTGKAYKGKSGDGQFEYKKSTDYNLLADDKDRDVSNLVLDRFNDVLSNKYLADYPHGDIFDHHRLVNGKTYYPLLQIQKYDQNEGHYNAWHLELEDSNTMMRAFVFILYLNDVEVGGETGFLFKEEGEDDFFKVKPETGKLIIHPASWPYVHKGFMPESSDKYILTTWLQFQH